MRFYKLALAAGDDDDGMQQAPQTMTTELALLADELVHHIGHSAPMFLPPILPHPNKSSPPETSERWALQEQ